MENIISIYKPLFKKISKAPRIANHKIEFFQTLYRLAKKLENIEDPGFKKASLFQTLIELQSSVPHHLEDCPEDIRNDVAIMFKKTMDWIAHELFTPTSQPPPEYTPTPPTSTSPEPRLG